MNKRWMAALCGTMLLATLAGCGGGGGLGEGSAAGTGTTTTTTEDAVAAVETETEAARAPRPAPSPTAAAVFEVRSYDGSGNNPLDSTRGQAGTAFVREVPAAWGDGVSTPSGADRPGARAVSNAVGAQEGEIYDAAGRTAFVWTWGQFLDHDLDLTQGGTEPFPIPIPTGDPWFDPTGLGNVVMNFTRSTGPEQTNLITSFIDGSQVYGSSQATADSLRTFQDGLLATSDGDLLPLGNFGFQAGDIRVNENLGLTSVHVLFMREHNRFAAQVKAANPSLTDEEIFQRARRHVGALIQVITYREFLPAILGRDALPPYAGYDPNVDPRVGNLFATAAFRLGHTMVSSTLQRLGPDGQPIAEGNLNIKDGFFQPNLLIDEGGVDPVLRGLALTVQQKVDTKMVDDLRNFLFGPPGAGGLDLLSLNLQRGRDHGHPDYNTIRQAWGRPAAATFADITSDPDQQEALASAYGTVNQIDPWVGLLSEDPVPGAAVGPTLRRILADQFRRTRDGDRFWYRRDPALAHRVAELEGTTLRDLIARNTGVAGLQPNVFSLGSGGRPPRHQPRHERYPRLPEPSL